MGSFAWILLFLLSAGTASSVLASRYRLCLSALRGGFLLAASLYCLIVVGDKNVRSLFLW